MDADSDITPTEFLEIDGEKIAVRHRNGRSPGIFWLGGYRSDMLGTKAQAIDAWAKLRGISFTRHDYSGHGESSGIYHQATISKWLAQSMAVFRRFAPATTRQILVGSSMGAWIALRMVQELNKQPPSPIAGMLLLAPAPDFTEELIEPELGTEEKEQLKTKGFFEEKSEYFPPDQPNIWTREMLEDAKLNNLVLTNGIDILPFLIRIIHGLQDKEVPVKLVDKLVSALPAENVQRIVVADGDHRLSRVEDIDLILRTLDNLIITKDVVSPSN